MNEKTIAPKETEVHVKTEDFKVLNNKYIKENWNEYEQLMIGAVNDFHATQFNKIIENVEKVNPNRCVNEKGTTMLHWVAGKKDIGFSKNNILSSLIEAGANPLLTDIDGMTALDVARAKNFPSNIEILEKAVREYTEFVERRKTKSVFKVFKISPTGEKEEKEIDFTGLDLYESKLLMRKNRI